MTVLAIETVGPCKKQLHIEVPAATVDREVGKVVADLGKRAKLPGFRQGKIPAGVVRQRFKDDIRQEVIERIIPKAWEAAEKESDLDGLAAPHVDEVGEFVAGEPFIFKASIEVRPEFELGSLEDFDLPERDEEPSEAEVTEALDNIRRQVADWVTVERPAARGDKVKTMIEEVTENAESEATEAAGGEEAPEIASEAQEIEVEIGNEQIWEELSLALTGLAVGQRGSFSRPEGEGDEARVRSFEVEVVSVEERDLPELDDEFAAKVGEFETVDALKEEVIAGVRRQKTEASDRARHQALREQLRARHPMELPVGVVDHEIQLVLRDYAGELQRRGVDLENAGLNWQEMGDQARPQAEQRVQERLILDRIAEVKEIEVGPDRVDAALATIARVQGERAESLRAAFERDGRMEGLIRQLRRERTVRSLLGDES
ncbi:MAG: trigger factor [Acidobacteriota bacterium]